MRFARHFTLLVLLPLLTGCAGGWRGGSAPAEWASAATTAAAPAAKATTLAPAAKAIASTTDAKATHGTADGAVFVWTGEGATVNVAGEFNAWSMSADPMLKQADGSFTLVRKLAPGKYQYKFVVDGANWKSDPNAAVTADDGYGGKNAVVVVGGDAAAAAAPVAQAAPAATSAGAGPAVTGDAVTFKWTGGGGTVNLAGEFNSWSTSADPMQKQADGSFTLARKLAPGKYQYKFVVDGTNWKEDPNAKETADDGYGGKNAVVVVGGAAGTAAAPAAQAAAAPAPASAVKPLAPDAKARAPQVTAAGVVFTYAGIARTSVALCGDFNSWAPAADAMTQQADGTWTITRKLAPGTYGYKFLVDGASWKQDGGNPEGKDDGFGGKNSVVTVK